MNSIFILVSLWLVHSSFSYPQRNDKALYEESPEERRRKNGKRPARPCRGRNYEDQGRTFFDLTYQQADINYNYNYNINCGGGLLGGGGGGNKPGTGGGGGNKPQHQHHQGGGLLQGLLGGNQQQGGGGGDNHRPIIDGLLGNGGLLGGNGPLSGIFSFSQSQSQSQSQGDNGGGGFLNPQSIGQGIGSFVSQVGDGIGSFLPSQQGGGGLFDGQGIGSLFENGLFSGIFGGGNNNGPSRPPVVSNPGPQPVTRPPPPIYTTSGHELVTTPKPPIDPDVIYNDERPVHEDHDAVVPDTYIYNRPAPNSYYNRHRYPNYSRDYSSRGRSNNIRFE